jgi:hypothetical protein
MYWNLPISPAKEQDRDACDPEGDAHTAEHDRYHETDHF